MLRPVSILESGTQEERGSDAQESAFLGAIAVADLVKSTLGPKGMDKILQGSGAGGTPEVQVTNDGATILKSVFVDDPAAKVLIEVSKTQDAEVGDGTTSVCVLSGELLKQASHLLDQNIHPQTIIDGFRIARKTATAALEASAIDNGADKEKFRKDLFDIAKTTLSSKILHQHEDMFAELAVNAVLRLKGSTNLEAIQIIKKLGGAMSESYLDDGFILEKKIGVGQPKRLENAKILVANTAMDTDKVKIFGSKVKVSSASEVAAIEAAEREKMIRKCQKIVDHGINCFINRQLIYNLPEEYFADHGIVSIEHADFAGIERLALVLGSDIVSTFDNPEKVKLGHCDLIEEIVIGEDTVLRFSGVALGEACTVVLRGSSMHMLDEAERSLHDALCVLSQTVNETKTVLGAGCAETLMANAVDAEAARTSGKVAKAIEGFANALRELPTIICNNAGLDSADLVAKLRAAHNKGESTMGLDLTRGVISDVRELRITESWKVKNQIVVSATEAAEMILRVDEIIKARPRPRERDPRFG